MPPKLLGLYLCWHSAGDGSWGLGGGGQRGLPPQSCLILSASSPASSDPCLPTSAVSALLRQNFVERASALLHSKSTQALWAQGCNSEQDTSLPSSQEAHFSKNWKWDSISIKFQLCEISYTDLLYNVVFMVSNTVLCTQTFKRVDPMLNALITRR